MARQVSEATIAELRRWFLVLVAECQASRAAWPKTNAPVVAQPQDVEAVATARAHVDAIPELAEALGVPPLPEE